MSLLVAAWKGRGLIAAVMAGIALMALGALLVAARADLKVKDATIQAQGAVITGLTSRVAMLQHAAADKDRALAEKNRIIAAGDAAAARLSERNDRIAAEAAHLRKQVRNASDDAAAIRLLVGGLCGVEERLAALRADHHRKNGARADADTAAAPGAACTGPIDGDIRAVSDYALRFAVTLEAAAHQIMAIGAAQDEHNAIVSGR